MRRAVVFTSFILAASAAWAGFPIGTVIDPYIITEFPVQIAGLSNAAGRTQESPVIGAGTAIIVTLGQSNIANNALGTYTVTNSTAQNMSVYDGGIYLCADPVLGPSGPGGTSGSSSPNCAIADELITNGVYSRVIMVPIAINGTLAADWNGASLASRITVAMRRLSVLGVMPTYILWHQGEQDNFAGTSGPAYTASVQAVATQFRNLGYTGPFFVATETYDGVGNSATIQTAQANAVSSPLHIVAGADWDSLTGGTNRQAGPHLTQVGSAAAAALDVTVITNCKNTSC